MLFRSASRDEVSLLADAFASGAIREGELHKAGMGDSVHVLAIPVRGAEAPIAVLTREWSSKTSRQPGELERTYLSIFQRFAEMISIGAFPFEGRAADLSAAPRVGDGAIVLDENAVIRYASPNAVSALHRVGITSNVIGQALSELGFADSPVRQAYERCEPVIEEFDQTADVTLLVRCIPIIADEMEIGRAHV